MKWKPFQSPVYNKVFWVLAALYFLFALLMIYRSSFIGADGHRHFALFDDAMIGMRYADNLIHGRGLVWNAGQRVEGFTGPLLVFLMALFIKVFGEIYSVPAMQILGLFWLAANLWLVLKITKRLLEQNNLYRDSLLFAALLLTMAWYPVLYWAILAMDTALLTTLVLWAVYLSLFEKPGVKINWLLSIVLGLTYLARPDSLLFLAVFFFFRFIAKSKSFKSAAGVIAEGLAVFFFVAGYQIFRLSYYHQWLPNTYILRATGMDLVDRVKNGLGYFAPFLERIQLFLAAVILFLFLFLFDAASPLRKRLKDLFSGPLAYPFMFVVLFGVFSLYQINVGGDPWPPLWRLTVPYTVLFFIAFVVIAGYLEQLLNIRPDRFAALFWLVVLSLLVTVPFDYHYDFIGLQPLGTQFNQNFYNQAWAINQLTDSRAKTAFISAGVAPYYDHRFTYDMLGKMDPYIAHLPPDLNGPFPIRGMTSIPGHNKYDLNYSLKQLQPDVIQYVILYGEICRWGSQSLQDWCLENYKVVNYHGVQVLLKKDSPHVFWDKIKG